MDNEALTARTACDANAAQHRMGLSVGTPSYGRNHNNRTTQVNVSGDQFSQSGGITLGVFTIISRIGQVSQHRVEPVSLDSQARLTAANCWGVVTKALFARKRTLKAARNINLVDELN